MAITARTDAELIEAIRSTIYDLVVGGAESRELNGRIWTAIDIDKLKEMEKFYTDKAGATKSRTNLVAFREPS